MASVTPNNNCGILIDEFIRMATAHLQTVSGRIITTANYLPANTPGPSEVTWKGYNITPTKRELDLGVEAELQRITNTLFKSDRPDYRDLGLVEEEELEELQEGVIYPNLTRADGVVVENYSRKPYTNFVGTNADARAVAEAYLGKPMSDTDWNNLVALTYAETTKDPEENAWVMATILNRTRKNHTPKGPKHPQYKWETVTDIISQPWQYQPVTGTPVKPGPVDNFINGPSPARAASIYGAVIQYLNTVPKTYTDFTSNDPKAYKAGTNINYLYELRKKPEAKILGGTIFAY